MPPPHPPDAPLPTAASADHAQAAYAILCLVREQPAQLLWQPGASSWGLAVVAVPEAAVVIALDGCIAYLHQHRLRAPPRRYRYATLARLLHGPLAVQRIQGQALVRCRLPPARCGACCIVVAGQDLPWLHQALIVTACSAADADADADADGARATTSDAEQP